MPQIQRTNNVSKLGRTRIIGSVIIAVIIILLAFIVWLLFFYHKAEPKIGVTTLQVRSTAVEALSKRDYDKVYRVLENVSDPDNKENLQLRATAALGQNDYKKALGFYQKVEKLYGLDASGAINIARVETYLGDKTTAISYYNKAESMLTGKSDMASRQTLVSVQTARDQLQKATK